MSRTGVQRQSSLVLLLGSWFTESTMPPYVHQTSTWRRYSNSHFLNDRIPNNWWTHTSTHARKHTNTQGSCGRWHAQLTVNLLFANNLEAFPYRTPQMHRCTWARHTIRSRHMEHHARANYIITQMFTYVLWHSNGTVTIKYSNIVLFVSALVPRRISMMCGKVFTFTNMVGSHFGFLDLYLSKPPKQWVIVFWCILNGKYKYSVLYTHVKKNVHVHQTILVYSSMLIEFGISCMQIGVRGTNVVAFCGCVVISILYDNSASCAS